MMKRLCMLLAAFSAVFTANAAIGDTTWVQAQNDVQMPNFGNYDSPVSFPDGSVSYRKIVMVVTLGKYQCPGNPQYCGDWDYTFQTFLMTPNGDTLELGRLITPYANVSYSRFPWTWKERYEFDVTDFYPVLKNNADIRVHYSGYSGGFTSNIKFAFVEGTPPRNVLGVERLWHGSFAYGKAADPIEDHLPAISKTAPGGTKSAEMKLNITGHGSDDNGCSEFCKKYYQVLVNSNVTDQKDIWRDDCGYNHLYPQSGTWVYDRGGWCPGDPIRTNVHKLPGAENGPFDVDLNMEPYTGSGNYGSYTIDAAIFYYGDFNKQVDASLEDIIAPTNHEAHFRENPVTASPTIKVRNTGAATITSLKIEYGLPGKYMPSYTWNGTINPLEEMEITLPELWELRSETGTNLNFMAKILEVNGQGDGDGSNNTLTSVFDAAPSWGNELEISFKTNASTDGNGNSETSYKVYDAGNNVILQRSGVAPNTTYIDTLKIGPGYFKIVVEDGGCDGLSFWANPNAGSGYFRVKKLGTIVPLSLKGYFGGDFGCGFTQYFNMNWPTAVQDIREGNINMEVYPNPAKNLVTVALNGVLKVDGMLRITDAIGRVVLTQKCTGNIEQVNVTPLAAGAYSVDYADAEGVNILHQRLVITK